MAHNPFENWGITLIEGPMGAGKSTTAAAYTIDAYRKSEGKIKIFAVNMHLYSSKDLKIKYVYCPSVHDLLLHCNSDLVSDGINIVDEAYIAAEARRGMNPMSILWSWYSYQIRKRHIQMYYIVQNGRFIEWRLRWAMLKRIVCEADDRNPGKIWLTVKYLQGPLRGTEKKFSYDGSQYWPYFDTDELPHIPMKMIEKAGAWA